MDVAPAEHGPSAEAACGFRCRPNVAATQSHIRKALGKASLKCRHVSSTRECVGGMGGAGSGGTALSAEMACSTNLCGVCASTMEAGTWIL